ncbi:MAG: FAD-dependent oxidoreductase, partial [Bacillota bacterium]|nr:FAD-dependent oxidoreductase [Bacillota bacterium]
MKKVAVIGAGPGGYVAAIRLAQLGADVHLVERDRVGGTCLNRGCIPTKTLFRTAEIMHEMKHAHDFGIDASPAKVDYDKLVERKEKVVDTLVGGIEQLIKSYPNIRFHVGTAHILEKDKIEVKANTETCASAGGEGACCSSGGAAGEIIDGLDAVIIANGSKPQMTETQGVE